MDMPDHYPTASKSPRSSLQGPRPAPLRVRKDSHKIRKPPVVPQPSQHPAAPPPRPVIIYTVSPKVIHANPNEFMTLVQRLTGSDHATSSSSSLPHHHSSLGSFQEYSAGDVSPAARFATIENAAKSPAGKKQAIAAVNENDMDIVTEGMEMIISSDVERSNSQFPGILSPNPASLQPIPANFFSPASDHHHHQYHHSPLGFFHDLSPVVHNNRHYLEGSFFYSPSTNNFPNHFISPRLVSPTTPNIDLFSSNIFDL